MTSGMIALVSHAEENNIKDAQFRNGNSMTDGKHMRATGINLFNDNRALELFIENDRNGYDLWTTGFVKGQRMILDHHRTQDDLEAQLSYAHRGDLTWRDAYVTELPVPLHQNAIEMKEAIRRGVIENYSNWPELCGRSLSRHLRSISLLALESEGMNAARKQILGKWTDGVITFVCEQNFKLKWACENPIDNLNIGELIHGHAPDSWALSKGNFI